ncbi:MULTISPECIES: TadE/TadG family type IV pilus assembly protein [Hyphobacterium]|uniref:TadE/TadG family type IV pilus assembly protein n=1 Tax=Hyphobacterium vulgare TaxID=1736751 RepID=A0ABV6ZV36_9PROT
MIRFIRSLARRQDGVSAVEFALIAPIMMLFYLGVVEVSLALGVDRKVTSTASALADLVAQDDVITDDEMAQILAAGPVLVAPHPGTPLQIRISSVTMNLTGDAEVDWSDARGMTPLGEGTRYTPPTGILSPGRSIIMVEVSYRYDSAFAEIGVGRFDIAETFYLRPRRSLVVSRQ